jgi:CTP-dependent riboflavin kinase
MKHAINNRFTLSSDNYNWILIDKQTTKEKRKYFSNHKQLSKFIVELKAKDYLTKGEVDLGDINSITPTYDAVTFKIVQDLMEYFSNITNGMTYQEFYKYKTNDTVSTPRFLHKESHDALL